jgi:protein disulfide-isomerase
MKRIPLCFFIPAVFALLCGFRVTALSQETKWYTDYAKAVEQAKADNKPILLDFTGSDWCQWCIKMKKETLDAPAFKQYAAQNLVLMEVDFPDSKPQTAAVKAQNAELKKKYKANGFPTFVLVDANGSVLGTQVGYLEGGPAKFIEMLNKFHKPNPAAASSTSGAGSDDFDKFFKKPAQ